MRKTRHYRRRRQRHKSRARTYKRRRYRGGGNGDVAATQQTLAPLLANPQTRQQNVLKSVCADPNNCLALGSYSAMINNYFDHFTNLSLIDNAAITVITSGNNGTVYKIPFTKDGYTSYGALKMNNYRDLSIYPNSKPADNLGYEWFIGKNFINALVDRFPCFLETYSLYKFNQPGDAPKQFDAGKFSVISPIEHISWSETCTLNAQLALMIQYFGNVTTFGDYNDNGLTICKADKLSYLYQIYFTLAILGSNYTHYDLHSNNVLLYKPFEGQRYIEMNYHKTDGTVVTFPAEHICKIIDYGRNYVNFAYVNPATPITSQTIIQEICKSPACQPNCGEMHGYSIIQGNENNPKLQFYYIFPNRPNISHDLRLAYDVWPEGNYDEPEGTYVYEHYYGTQPRAQPLAMTNTSKKTFAANVIGMEQKLAALIRGINAIDFIMANNNYNKVKYQSPGWTKAAIMHIYADGRNYTFEKV